MKNMSLWGNRRFLLAAAAMLAFVAIIVASRLLFSQNDYADSLTSNAASILCALIATAFFVAVWFSTSEKDISKEIWGLFAISMGLWTMAEGIWAYYEVVLGEEVPYPSIADLFWLVGYVPLFLAINTQYRIFQAAPTQRQKTIIVLIVAVFSLIVGGVVLIPIIMGFDPQRILESLINIAYPLLDLVLLILTVIIVFSLEQGRFGFTWRLLGTGLVFVSVADLLFSYASWNEIYNPEGQLNAITLLIDMFYYSSYLILGLGVYAYRLSSEPLQAAKFNIVLRSLAKTNILVFIDREGKIISLSDNFVDLVGAPAKDPYMKVPLSEALKIDNLILENLVAKTLEQGSLSTQPLKIRDAKGNSKDIWLTSFAIKDQAGRFVCIAAVLRTDFAAQAEKARPLTEEQRSLIKHYLTEAGTYRSEENQVIKAYFLEQVSLLYSLIHQFSGLTAADKLLSHLKQVAGQYNWQFVFNGQNIEIPEEYEGETLARHLSILLQEAKNYAGNMTNLTTIEHEMGILDNNLSADTLRYLDKYNLRSIAKSAA